MKIHIQEGEGLYFYCYWTRLNKMAVGCNRRNCERRVCVCVCVCVFFFFIYFEIIVSERVKREGTDIDFRGEGIQRCSNLWKKLMDCEWSG